MFGTLVKGLRFGLDLLTLLQKEGHIRRPLLKLFKIPSLSGSDGLDLYLKQFEAAVDSDFPNYQVYIRFLLLLVVSHVFKRVSIYLLCF